MRRKRLGSGAWSRSVLERLEPRLALTNDIAPVLVERVNNGLVITYNQSVTSEQHVVIDIDASFSGIGATVTRVNVYASTNPVANPPVPPAPIGGAPFLDIDYISVVVPNYDDLGVNNNSLTLKGINTNTDRFIVSGSGRTAAGRWSDEEGSQLQIAFDIEGIDNLTLTAGGIINVSGAFTNDTDDASLHVFGTIVERESSQLTSTVVVGETTPLQGGLPQSRLFSNVIEIVSAEFDIYSDIEATDAIVLRGGENAPADARHDLILPYDITVTGDAGVLELYSTQNIVQLQGSTLTAHKLVAVSNNTAAAGGPDGPWMIDLGSVGNDFDTISLGMTSAPGDDPDPTLAGRIGIRDIDDLTIADFGILAATGQIRLDVGGSLAFNARIEATGLSALSGDSIFSAANAAMQIGEFGLTLRTTQEFSATSTGDITLNAPIVVDDPAAAELVVTAISASGLLTIAGGLRSPQGGTTTLSGVDGVTLAGPVQVGSTLLDPNGAGTTIFSHDLAIVSTNGSVLISNVPGNQAVVKAIEATNIVSIDAAGDITVAGSVFSGTLYGNPTALAASEALPSLVLKAGEGVTIATTGVLQTSAFQNDGDAYPNSLVGRISIAAATHLSHAGAIVADGAVALDVIGDVELIGSTQAKESIRVSTTAGSIDVQGSVRTTGFEYATTLPAALAAERTPNIRLLAQNGGITTSNLGTLTAGTMTVGGEDTYGLVELAAQQDIVITAAIDTEGGVAATSKIGAFELDALLRAGNDQAVVIAVATGVLAQGDALTPAQEFARIIAASLDVTNTSSGDILITAAANEIGSLTARNLATAGLIEVRSESAATVSSLRASGGVIVASLGSLTVVGSVSSEEGGITLSSTNGNVDLSAASALVNAVAGAVSVTSSAGSVSVQQIEAGDGVTLSADQALTVIGSVLANAGDITVTSTNRDIDLSAATALLHAVAGQVTATASAGAIAVNQVEAGTDVTVTAGQSLTVDGSVTSEAGDITLIARRNADLSSPNALLLAFTGDVSIQSSAGAIISQQVVANSIEMSAFQGVRSLNKLNSTIGDMVITTVNGNLDFSDVDSVISCENGGVTLMSLNGGIISPPVLHVAGDINLRSYSSLNLANQLTSDAGNILLTSTDGALTLGEARSGGSIAADAKSLIRIVGSVEAADTVTVVGRAAVVVDGAVSSVSNLQINAQRGVTLSSSLNSAAGDITVTTVSGNLDFSDPAAVVSCENGGVTLTSFNGAIISPPVLHVLGDVNLRSYSTLNLANQLTSDAGNILLTSTDGALTVGEVRSGGFVAASAKSLITVDGAIDAAETVSLTGKAAIVIAGPVSAVLDLEIGAQRGVTLSSSLNSAAGDITVTTVNGNLDFSDPAAIVSCEAGGVTLSSFNGAIISPPVLHVTGDVSLRSYARLAVANELTSDAGSISLQSTNGGVALDSNLSAFDRITLDAAGGILQSSGILQAEELDVRNKSALPVVLGSLENNVERFAAASVGAVTYSDADAFETGLTRGGVFGDQTVAVSTNGALSLQSGVSSAGPLRIVGGLKYARNQLFLSSGSVNTPGTVEFVVTNNTSSGTAFSGSLANMITYSNENQARFSGAVVPQEIVFDAEGYEITTVSVAQAIPVVVQPVTIDGSRTEGTVAVQRVGILSGGAVNGLVFGAGSAGSEVTTLAITGFSQGAGVQLRSSGTTIVDTFFGQTRLGTSISANLYGVDLFGAASTGNTVGAAADDIGTPDTLLANVFRGNAVGVIARSRAFGNEIVGNFIGTNASGISTSGNTVGVQLDAATATAIVGNVIANNGDGVLLNGTKATAASLNVIESNLVSRNGVGTTTGAGIRLSGSSFAAIGRVDSGNVIQGNRVGVIIENGSTANTIAANYIGAPDGSNTKLRNAAGGIQVVASIGNTIGGLAAELGNTVAWNTGAGITIRNSLAPSLASGNVVQANVILESSTHGVLIDGGAFQTIGGGGEAGNIVHSNGSDGIRLQSFMSGGKTTVSASNAVRGNLIGTDTVDGSVDLGNGRDGISIVGGSANLIEQGNVSRFNGRNGIYVEASSTNVIGSNTAGQGNAIGDNAITGIVITGGASNAVTVNNVVSGNAIFANGTTGDWKAGATGAGVLVRGSQTSSTVIGTQVVKGRQVGVGNTISSNAGYGVSVIAGAQHAQVQGNSIYENGSNFSPLPVVLPPGGASIFRAAGANSNVAAPTIDKAEIRYAVGTAPQVVISGRMSGTIGQTFAIDFYATPGYFGGADMRAHVGRVTVTITNATATLFTATLSLQSAQTGDRIAATATTLTVPATTASSSPRIATPIGSTSMLSMAKELTLPTIVLSSSPNNRTRRV